MINNKDMKFGKNWIDDESISDEEVDAYIQTLEPVEVLNIFQKLELDIEEAKKNQIALEEEIKARKLG